MMWFVGILTVFLILDCLFLMLLVLVQLPKKEAGAGIAFGGGATDALFGAGSGNALTKITKYSATFFVGMAVLLSTLHMQAYRSGSIKLDRELARQASTRPAVTAVVLSNA